MRVLILSAKDDTGGVGIGIVEAFRRYAPDWEVRFARRSDNYIGYPADLEWPRGDEEAGKAIAALHDQADVVHHFQRFITFPGWEAKPKVIHHHGTIFRQDSSNLILRAKQYRARAVASTLDLVAADQTSITYVPNPYAHFPMPWSDRSSWDRDPLRVAHAPTHRPGKSTDVFIEAFRSFSAEHHATLDLIERQSWLECLERKAMAHLYYDQVLVGYGNNAIESWLMGIPVIAGIDPARAREMKQPIPTATRSLMLSKFGELPFYEANEGTIIDALRAMTDPDVYRHYAEIGHRHATTWHDGQATVKILKKVYESA